MREKFIFFECSIVFRLCLSLALILSPILTKGQDHSDAQPRIEKVEQGVLLDPFIVSGVPPRTQSISEAMKEAGIPGLSLAVIEGEKISWARGYGVTTQGGVPISSHTLFSAGSLTKLVSAIAVLRLVDQRRLSLDADVNSYLRSWHLTGTTAHSPVTLRQLLSHTSGIQQHFFYSYKAGESLPTTLDILKGKVPARNPTVTRIGKPGEKFDYSSAGYSVVQMVLEDVTRQKFPDVIKEQVFKPTGMTDSTFEQPDASNFRDRAVGHLDQSGKLTVQPAAFPELASSGMWTTATDVARLLICLRKSGCLLSEKSWKAMTTPVKENSGLGVFLAGEGSSLRIRARTSDGRPEDGYSGWVTCYINSSRGAVILANSYTAFSKGFAMLRSIAHEYDWPGYLAILPGQQNSNLQAYVGKYQLDEPITISNQGEALVVSYGELEKVPLLPSGQNSFVVNFEPVSDFVLTFHMGSQGKADRLTLTTGFRRFEAPRIEQQSPPSSR